MWPFGTAELGSFVMDGVNTLYGVALIGNTYVFSDISVMPAFEDLTIDPGITLNANGRQVYVNGTLTNNGTIAHVGNNGVGASGGVGGGLNFYSAGGSGKTGTTGVGSPPAPLSTVVGGNGGIGGGSVAFPSPTGPSASPPTASSGGLSWCHSVQGLYTGRMNDTAHMNPAQGGGSGSGDTVNSGGGGGAGGGHLGIFARYIAGSGTFTVRGGNGAQRGVGNTGGGGGGGGGIVQVVTTTANWQSLITVVIDAGTGGLGTGTGSAGADGSPGRLVDWIVPA